MKPSDDVTIEPGDAEIVRRLKGHGEAIEAALPAISGAEIRETLPTVSPPNGANRRRAPFLVAAAALVVAGGIAAIGLGRDTAETPLETSPAATDDDEAADQPPIEDQPDPVDEDQPDPIEVEDDPVAPAGEDMMPIPVSPAEFGRPDVRFLPPVSSGLAVAAGSQVLLSSGNLEPTVSAPERTQRVSLPASDPTDRRAVLVNVSTWANEAGPDAFLEAEPTPMGEPGEPTDIDGRPGAWHETEGFAPYSAGTPMRTIRSLRFRFDATTVVDVVTTDVSRAEMEALVTSLSFAEDGSLDGPNPPAGFVGAEPIDGRSPGGAINDPSASDNLVVSLAGGNGEEVDLVISTESAGLTPTGAHFEDARGYGWIEAGLFGEIVVSFVGEDVTLILRSYNGLVSADELVELARSIEPVDEATWVERLAFAPLFHAPVSGASLPTDDD